MGSLSGVTIAGILNELKGVYQCCRSQHALVQKVLDEQRETNRLLKKLAGEPPGPTRF